MAQFDRQLALEDFESFLLQMDEQLDGLREEAEAANVNLDMLDGDFEKLELLFDRVSDGLADDRRTDLVIAFARYLGELVRKLFGGDWSLPLDDEKSVNFNWPVIVGHSPVPGLEFAPISTMKAYALRKRPGTLRRAVMADVRPQALDLSDLVED